MNQNKKFLLENKVNLKFEDAIKLELELTVSSRVLKLSQYQCTFKLRKKPPAYRLQRYDVK
jgi:hypothetical protein